MTLLPRLSLTLTHTPPGEAPWWFAFEETADGPTVVADPSSTFLVGDRGFVIRSFSARLGGVQRASPSFSVRYALLA